MDKSVLLNEFSNELGLPRDVAYRIARTAPLRYKVYTIKKRNGGDRVIAQPAKEVKAFQYLLISRLKSRIPVHEAAMAYRQGTSILKNAQAHTPSSYLLKMDFSNFFPSIVESDLIAHLKRHCADWLTEGDIRFICHIALWAPGRQPPRRLCIGAPTSPLLSNSIMYEFDGVVSSRSKDLGVRYTRYADDLSFSSDSGAALSEMQKIVGEMLEKLDYPQLILNKGKTVHASKAGNRTITGLVLTPDGAISVGRDRKRIVRAMYWRFLQGQLNLAEIEKMNGYLAYIDSIEPGFSTSLYMSMGNKFSGNDED